VSTPFGTSDDVSKSAKRCFEANATLLCLIDGIDEKPPFFFGRSPFVEEHPISRSEWLLKPSATDIFNAGEERVFTGFSLLLRSGFHLCGFAAPSLREQNYTPPSKKVIPTQRATSQATEACYHFGVSFFVFGYFNELTIKFNGHTGPFALVLTFLRALIESNLARVWDFFFWSSLAEREIATWFVVID
jgi:hypothetical protein